jgi:hypothetical protein
MLKRGKMRGRVGMSKLMMRGGVRWRVTMVHSTGAPSGKNSGGGFQGLAMQ